MSMFLERGELEEFIKILSKNYAVLAPVKTDITRFQKITSKDTARLDFSANTRVSPVKFLFPYKEIIAEIKDNKMVPTNHKVKPQIIFGIRNCDTNAIRHLDFLFLGDYKDPYYKEKRDNTLLFSVRCEEPMDTCFCESTDNKDFFDAKLIQTKDGFIIESGSDKGKELLDSIKILKNFEGMIPEKKACTLQLTNKNLDAIKRNFDNQAHWVDADKCFSCSACNMLCPSCSCFDVKDVVNADLKSGQRVRVQDGCHNRDFTRVAGNYVFRDKRLDRYRHRIYHKIVYFKERFGEYMCTGCGRCIAQCPSKINWVETLNYLK